MNRRIAYGATTGLIILALVSGAVLCFRSERYSESRIISECSQARSNVKALCYTERVNNLLKNRGLKAALSLVAASYAKDPGVASFCHANMHDLGAAAYKQFASKGQIDLSSDASFCGFGLYHGFMEEMLVETGSLDQARSFCTYVGKELGGAQAYAEGSCYHGIGHGVTDGTDVPKRGSAAALAAPGLALCRTVSPEGEYATRCASGVFNSVALMYRDPIYKLDAHDDPYALCRTASYDASEKKACYDQMNTLVSYISDRDPHRALSYPAAIRDPYYRSIAIKTAMTMVFAPPSLRPSSEAPGICASLSGEDRDACVRGLVDGLIEFGSPGSESHKALSFCSAKEWSLEEGRICMDEIIVYAQGLYSKDRQVEICEQISAALVPPACDALRGVAKRVSYPHL
jgi:hypothetical protein